MTNTFPKEPAATSFIADRDYALLPRTPKTTSPVPRLTSLHHFEDRNGHGDRRYPGNCNGGLIRDLLLFFGAKNVFDPMTGSGTCAAVCRELGISCTSKDIRTGFDATDPAAFVAIGGRFDFIWAHPPYWRQKLYTSHSRDLSRAATLEDFLEGYAAFINNCAGFLAPRGKFAILMGEHTDREEDYTSLTYHTKRLAHSAGLRQHCTDIIRFLHGNSSSRTVYPVSFIPTLHDTCMVFERA